MYLTTAVQPMDLIGNASAEDLQALFGGLDNFPTSSVFPVGRNFPGSDEFPADQRSLIVKNSFPMHTPFGAHAEFDGGVNHSFVGGPVHFSEGFDYVVPTQRDSHASGEAFAMHQLNTVVNDLHARCTSRQHSHASRFGLSSGQPHSNHPPQPVPVPNPLQACNRTATPTLSSRNPPESTLTSNTAPVPNPDNSDHNALGLMLSRVGTSTGIARFTQAAPSIHPWTTNSMEAHSTCTPIARHCATPNTYGSRPSTPTASPYFVQAPMPSRASNTRALVSLTRANVRSSGTESPILPAILDKDHSVGSPLRQSHGTPAYTPPYHSPDLPEIASNADDTGVNFVPEQDELSDSNAPRPLTPVFMEDTDLDPVNFPPLTAARQPRAAQFQTIRLLPCQLVHSSPARIPTQLDLRSNALSYYKLSRRRRRVRHVASDAQPLRIGMRAGTLNGDQKVMMQLMEHHMLWDMIVTHPWPEDRDKFLQDAQDYAEALSGVSGPGIVTEKFKDTVSTNVWI